MATTEATRPRLWVQLTAASDWLLAASQTQKQQQTQKEHQNQNPNLIRAFSRSFAAQSRLQGVKEVRA